MLKKRNFLFSGIMIVSALLSFLPFSKAWAAFSFSVTPYEGGYDLRFGKISPASGRVNREARVRITSSIGKQYRLLQMINESLSTAEGKQLPNRNFVVYGIRGTNRYGALNVEGEFPVSLGRQLLYTSNQAGTSDTFTLVYGIIASDDISPGSYRGRISFILEPIASTENSVNLILNIFAEVEVESAVTITTATGGRDITLRSDKEDMTSVTVLVNIQGGFGKQFRILEMASEQPVSAEGNTLGWPAVKFLGRGAQKGMLLNEPTALSSKQQILYTSSARGEPEGFEIEYSLGDLSSEKAGVYKSKIKYFLESPDAQMRLINTLDLEIEHSRVFELMVFPEQAQGVLKFPGLKPKEPPKKNEVTLEVKTNMGKRYQVNQNIYSDLINKEGKIIPAQYFTFRTESIETKGTLKFPQSQEAKKGDTTLFISDDKGSADKFKAIYELSVPWEVPAGDYSTRITYSLSEI